MNDKNKLKVLFLGEKHKDVLNCLKTSKKIDLSVRTEKDNLDAFIKNNKEFILVCAESIKLPEQGFKFNKLVENFNFRGNEQRQIYDKYLKEFISENEILRMELEEKKLLDEALRESNERFKDIVFSFDGWIYEIDKSENIIYSSDKIKHYLGYQPIEVFGKNFMSFLQEDSASDLGRYIRNREVINDYELWTTGKNGNAVCLSITGLPIIDKDGNYRGYRGVIKDITLRKIAEEELGRLNEELYRSNKDLEQFAYFASHDLREPLRMVSEFISLLEKKYSRFLDDDGMSFIDYALQGTKRMQKMIEGLLAFARINTRGEKFRIVNLTSILKSVLTDLKFLIEETNTTVNYEKLPVIYGDESQIASLFQNLITNSIKYRKGNSCNINIKVIKREGEWVFTFTDNGVGFDMKDSDRIFGLFESLNNNNAGSNGIGLALCKRIVERHNGKIWAKSEKDKYTSIYFTIPVADKKEIRNKQIKEKEMI